MTNTSQTIKNFFSDKKIPTEAMHHILHIEKLLFFNNINTFTIAQDNKKEKISNLIEDSKEKKFILSAPLLFIIFFKGEKNDHKINECLTTSKAIANAASKYDLQTASINTFEPINNKFIPYIQSLFPHHNNNTPYLLFPIGYR